MLLDATGNRILKETPTGSTAYVRDGSGNVLSVYSQPAGGNFAQTEVHLYGSSRLGMATTQGTKDVTVPLSCGFDNGIQRTFTRGEKLFELSNHLGNVLATVTDKRIALPQTGIPAFIGHYEADIASAQDYYPFGMLQPERKWNTGGYRYGFNGKENDNEVKGAGNQQDYGMRIYDPRVGRFLSVDPITKKYPELTPYQFASNTPIWGTDWDGLEVRIYTETKGTGHTFLTVGNAENLVLYTYGRYAGGNSLTLGTTGPGVLIKYTGAEATAYLKTELYQNEVKAFQISGVKDADVGASMDKKYNSSTTVPDTKNESIKKYGHVIDTYSLFGNNCTTSSCDALKNAGTDIFDVDGWFYDYDEDFTIPKSLQDFLTKKAKNSASKVTDVTNNLKQQYPNDSKKGILKCAGSSGETSGASGSSAGSSANSSSTTGSSSGNGSGSSGSGSGSSSSQDTDPTKKTN